MDAQITEAIQAKADELENDPLKIYTWVRNNIEFIPSYGSIQGAEYTLQSGKGNSFDTASLTIALLRASNIPARYAYGTVEVPADKVMNWVGGVEVPAAAQQLLGQGGIPNTGITEGGQVSIIRLEHVWVEAWVDYFPSRGAKHTVGDSWVPMDASFKQYEYTEGVDLQSEVPLDAEALVAEITASADINEEEGYVAGIDQAALEQALQNYQTEIEDHINNQNPEATVGDVLGTQKIILKEYPTLAAGLPYQVIARTQSYAEIPNNLRHKFRYTLAESGLYGFAGPELLKLEESLPALAGKKLALAFKPATEADEETLLSYLPEPDDNGEIDPAALPQSLPGHLIRMQAQFLVDGQEVLSKAAGNMGGELQETLALYHPSFRWSQSDNTITTGEYQAIALGFQGANPVEAIQLQKEVEATKLVLESNDETARNALTRQDLSGNLLNATIKSYIGLNSVQDQIQASSGNVVAFQQPSYGKFSTRLSTSYWFGVPRDVSLDGLVMDVDRLAVSVAAMDNSESARLNFMAASGNQSSAMEHILPEQMFGTVDAPTQGISAVKALALAASAGQKIWTIGENNLEVALASVSHSLEVENEIRNSVKGGKIATIHDSPLDYAGGAYVGYKIIDPITGAGAYKIGGGENGGLLSGVDISVQMIPLLLGGAGPEPEEEDDPLWPYLLTLGLLAWAIGGGGAMAAVLGAVAAFYLLFLDFQNLNQVYGGCGPEARQIIIGYALIQIILIAIGFFLVGTGGLLVGIALLVAGLIASQAVRTILGFKCNG